MISYGPLAKWYDDLTEEIPYGQFAEYYKKIFLQNGSDFHLLLDLCCGTGTLTCKMAEAGYEMIGTDGSAEMLSMAMNKAYSCSTPPLFLCQQAEELDLYGTVDAAYSSLDSINYIPPDVLPEVFRRLSLFIRPGGLFIFDIRSESWLQSLDGQVSVSEDDNVLCLWRTEFNRQDRIISYYMDIFSRRGKLWERNEEIHTEYAYSVPQLKDMLSAEGFTGITVDTEGPQGEIGRVFFVCKRNG